MSRREFSAMWINNDTKKITSNKSWIILGGSTGRKYTLKK